MHFNKVTNNLLDNQAYIIQEELNILSYNIQQQLFLAFPVLSENARFQTQSLDLNTAYNNPNYDFSPYQELIGELSEEERVVLALAISIHIAPQKTGIFLTAEGALEGAISAFGGFRSPQYGRFMPTFQTAFFILGGSNIHKRVQLSYLLDPDHLFYKRGILKYPSESIIVDSLLELTPEYLHLLTDGKSYHPQYSSNFPAQQITTNLNWHDLVLANKVMEQVKEIEYWILHQERIMESWGLKKQLKKGYKAIFYGPSGTGKTLTATLLGKSTNLPVYRIDMSSLVSKYIGETEKNLENLFRVAENKNWILFFDEAESLFAKRGAVKDASDQYANQTTTYLLQRIEDYNGVVLLATNKPASIDDAFKRRFQNIIEFPKPNETERLRLWEQAFTGHLQLSEAADLKFLAKHYDHVTGGILINILRDCAIQVAQRNIDNIIHWDDIIYSLRKQYQKHLYMWTDPEKKGWKST